MYSNSNEGWDMTGSAEGVKWIKLGYVSIKHNNNHMNIDV